MIRRLLFLTVLTALLFSLVLVPFEQPAEAATDAAPSPQLIAEVNGPGKGRVWVGAIPAGSSSKPVLVFVHGLHGKAQDWWSNTVYSGRNDMYDQAYAAGYRTAFVSLDDEVDGPASSMWHNGWTLNRQLDVIMNHYGVSSVNIIAHSKGGVDSNSAIVHYGAAPKVQKVVTLSSPHHGSELADLAYSWWAGWLAELLGQRDTGTYVMQTGYMSYFRSVTDSSSAYQQSRFYTSAGTDWGPWFSAMWFGGAYLPGDNDGVVTVRSSNHPRQYGRLFTSSSLNHDNIRRGGNVWWRIEPTVRTTWRTAADQPMETPTISEETMLAPLSSPNIFRGGEIKGAMGRTTLPIEGGVNRVAFDLLSNSADLSVTFVAPSGQRHSAAAPVVDGAYFKGAFHYQVEINAPESGLWTVEMRGQPGQRAGYLLVSTLDSPLSLTVQHPAVVDGALPSFQANVAAQGSAVRSLSVTSLVAPQFHGADRLLQSRTAPTYHASAVGNQLSLDMPRPRGDGLYQLGLTVTGTAADGSRFERSFASSFPVMTGELGIEALLPVSEGNVADQ